MKWFNWKRRVVSEDLSMNFICIERGWMHSVFVPRCRTQTIHFPNHFWWMLFHTPRPFAPMRNHRHWRLLSLKTQQKLWNNSHHHHHHHHHHFPRRLSVSFVGNWTMNAAKMGVKNGGKKRIEIIIIKIIIMIVMIKRWKKIQDKNLELSAIVNCQSNFKIGAKKRLN